MGFDRHQWQIRRRDMRTADYVCVKNDVCNIFSVSEQTITSLTLNLSGSNYEVFYKEL